MSRQERRSDSFDFAQRVFGDGPAGRGGVVSDPTRRSRRTEFRAASEDCRRSGDMPRQHYEERHGQDVPFGRGSRVPPMGNRGTAPRHWEDRSH